MKRLINIPTKVWAAIITVFIISIIFIIFLISYKIESTIHIKGHSKGSTQSIYVNSDTAYKIKKLNIIHIRIGENTYDALIKNIIYDEGTKMYQLTLSGLNVQLLPNSIMDAIIITGKHPIGSFLFGSV